MHKGNILPNSSFGSVARTIDKIGKISAQPDTLIIDTFCDINSIHARSLCKRVSMTVMYVKLMYRAVRKTFSKLFWFRKLFGLNEIVCMDWPFTVLFVANVRNSVKEICGSFVYLLTFISIH